MKTEDLVKLLRKLIKEEVKRTVADEVNKSMARLLGEVIGNKSAKPVVTEQVEAPPAAPPKRRFNTNNPKLDAILNSTTNDLRERDAMAGVPDTGVSLAEGFDNVGAEQEPVYSTPEPEIDTSTKIGMLKSIVTPGPVTQQRSVVDSAPAELQQVFKKDFRQLMKAMDKQKTKGSGGIFTGAVPITPQTGNYDQE